MPVRALTVSGAARAKAISLQLPLSTSDRLIVLNREMERRACLRSISGVGIESDEVMPPKDDMLTKGEIGIIRAWIDRGGKFDPPGAAQK